jgi:serine-type D-Ala-D-Ala carboxypeptidase/endopeptidase (penicillin-binding protein 4)
MKKTFLSLACLGWLISSFAQPVNEKLQKTLRQFEADSQLRHAVTSLYVIDASTGQVVFDKNSQVGLAPASTQKIITSVTAFELLGNDYRYKTFFVHRQDLHRDNYGELEVSGNFDPSLGSNRYVTTKAPAIFANVLTSLLNKKHNKLTRIVTLSPVSRNNPVPGGYIWDDIGNYYGSGVFSFNWRENQYDMILRSGPKNGFAPEIIRTEPAQRDVIFYNFLATGEEGSGDNAYIYATPFSKEITVRGTIPPSQQRFIISGAMPDPAKTFSEELYQYLSVNGVSFKDTFRINNKKMILADSFALSRDAADNNDLIHKAITYPLYGRDTLYVYQSPSLDSIIYWFLKKSINLYGEALVKTFAYEKTGFGSTDTGIAIVRKFWKEKGLDEDELNIYDGSGLSPLNRVTTHAQVEILKYAKTKDWFPSFYTALPEYNNMTMKSGTISDTKGFCGYHTARDGKEYIFSFLVNNYTGRSAELVNKMYKVLDCLK